MKLRTINIIGAVICVLMLLVGMFIAANKMQEHVIQYKIILHVEEVSMAQGLES